MNDRSLSSTSSVSQTAEKRTRYADGCIHESRERETRADGIETISVVEIASLAGVMRPEHLLIKSVIKNSFFLRRAKSK